MRGGTGFNTYLTKSKGKKFVLKMYPKREKVIIRKLVALLRRINAKGEMAIDPINLAVLSHANNIGFVYPFFEGRHFRTAKVPNKFYMFGRIAADFDRRAAEIKLGRTEIREAQDGIAETISDGRNLMASLKRNADPFSKRIVKLLDSGVQLTEGELAGASKCRIQLLHLDIHFDNVIYDQRTKKYRIIDVNGIRAGYLPAEIAVVISDHLGRSAAWNRKMIMEIMSGYESRLKLSRNEKMLIPFFMVLRKIGELVWLSGRYKKGKLSKVQFLRFSRISARYLKILIGQYEQLLMEFSI